MGVKLRAQQLWAQSLGFLRDELWDAEIEPRSWAARGLSLLQFASIVAEGFVRDHLLLRASALTYFTVLSLIPLVAIAVAIGNALGMTANLAETVVKDNLSRIDC